MLRIRPEQLDAFETARLMQFADTAVAHVRATRPLYFEAAGEAAVRESVCGALAKARRYGIRRGEDLLRFLNVCLILGFDFDEDGRYPWARPLLEDAAVDAGLRVANVVASADAMLRGQGR
jgi:hypothetical protein